MNRQLMCVRCGSTYPCEDRRLRCDCGGLLDVQLDMDGAPSHSDLAATFETRLSSCSRRPLRRLGAPVNRSRLPPANCHVPEGRTTCMHWTRPLGLSASGPSTKAKPHGSFKDAV